MGLITLIIPIIFFIFENITDPIISKIALSFSLISIVIAGYLLLSRIYYADVSKSKTMFSINLIKQYFVDNHKEIEAYMYYGNYVPNENKKEKDKQIKPGFHYLLTFSILAFNSLIIGFVFLILQNLDATKITLRIHSFILPILVALILYITSMLCFVSLFKNYKLNK